MRHGIIVSILLGLIGTGLSGCRTGEELLQHGQALRAGWQQRQPDQAEVAAGLKEALQVGTQHVVRQVSRDNGFNADPHIHIPLPDKLRKAQAALQGIGLAGSLNDLELRLNRAAEQAAPRAGPIFVQAIRQMQWQDVMQIYRGGDDAATRYFQRSMTPALKRAMRPVIEQQLARVGALQSYESVVSRAGLLPYVPDIRQDLANHVLDRALQGMFYYLAEEEAAIRKDPARRTTQLLRRVFGQAG